MKRMHRILPIILIAAAIAAGVLFGYVRSRKVPAVSGPKLVVDFTDAARGCAVIVTTPEGKSIVIDPGPAETADALLRYLHALGIVRVEILVTNPSAARAGGLETLLRSISITRITKGELQGRSRAWKRAIQDAEELRVPVNTVSGGGKVRLTASTTLEVLSPPPGLLANAGNQDNSLVVRLAFGKTRLLIMSDAGTIAEGYLLSSVSDLASDVLAVGRHGRDGGTSLELLRAVRPGVIVIAPGRGEFRPSAAVLERVDTKHTGAELFRTDIQGPVTLATDGESVSAFARERVFDE